MIFFIFMFMDGKDNSFFRFEIFFIKLKLRTALSGKQKKSFQRLKTLKGFIDKGLKNYFVKILLEITIF